MKYDVENLNPGAWFNIPNDTGRICLRTLSFNEANEIRKQTMKKEVEYVEGQRYEFEETNENKQLELTWDTCIISWENIQDAEGANIPCTTENKFKLMRGSPSFARMVNKFLGKLARDESKAREIEAKN